MRNPDRETVFRFKQFDVSNRLSAMKVGTDGVLLGAWSSLPPEEEENALPEAKGASAPVYPSILDVGCGTGLIALMLAQRCPQAHIRGIEIDNMAAEEAQGNFSASPWADRLSVIKGDFIAIHDIVGDQKFDLIVSNPPFFTTGEKSPDQARMAARHEASLPLSTLVETSCRILSDNGHICIVLPADREEELKYLAVVNHLCLSRLTRVSTVTTKPPRRILAELRHGPSSPTILSQLHIHGPKGGFSAEYISLVKDFYLNF